MFLQIEAFVAQYCPAIVGFFMPVLVELINRDVKNSKVKFGITIALCLLVAVLLDLSKIVGMGINSLPGLLASLTLIFSESQVVFKLYFGGSDLQKSMQSE